MALRHRLRRWARGLRHALRTPEPDNRLRLVTHNVWVGQRGWRLLRNLARLARDTDYPHVIAVQEAKHLRRPIRGYQLVHVAEPLAVDDRDMALLVRQDWTVVHDRFPRVSGPWWRGPKHGKMHPPKVFVGATIERDGHRWDVLCVHRTWTGRGKRNMESWHAEHHRLVRYLDNRALRDHGHRPVIPLGDWNGSPRDTHPNSVAELATQLDALVAFRGIDGALAINCTSVRARELDDLYGSDGHRPVVITVEV